MEKNINENKFILGEDFPLDHDENFIEKLSNNEINKGGILALIILTSINLLNYIDRYIPSATKDLFKHDLFLSDTETSIPIFGFLIIYLISSPIFGTLSDRGVDRRILIAIGVVLWSISTSVAFFAVDFWSFLICRMMVGIGESAYATIAPALLSDFFPPSKRNLALTIFNAAIPVGSAFGFTLGGIIGHYLGWRYSFLICGLPGIFLAILILKIREPGRGVYENDDQNVERILWIDVFKSLSHNKVYIVTVCGYILVTFAEGGMGDWLPTYLNRVMENINYDSSGIIVGSTTVIGGISGTILGGILADLMKGYTRQPYLAISCFTLIPATVLSFICIFFIRKIILMGLFLLILQIFLWCNLGPINALIANSVNANIRARAFAISIFLIHILGDAISPLIIGIISDKTDSITAAVSIIPISMALSCIIWGIGWRFVEEPDIIYSKLLEQELSSVNDSFNFKGNDESMEEE